MTALHTLRGARARRAGMAFVLASMAFLGLAHPAAAAAATKVALLDVSKSLNTGETDGIAVVLRDETNTTDATYTGTVTFSADCSGCFTITPNNGGTATRSYTYVAGDGGNKNFSLIWTQAGTHTLTVTATLAGGGITSAGESGIVVGEAATTTTTAPAVTTTSTTVAPCTAPRLVVSPATVSQKQSVTLTGSCYPADTVETVVLTSSPVVLGGVRSTAAGTFTVVVVIPGNTTAGAHTLTVGGVGGSAAVGITVVGTPFAVTGGSVSLLGLGLAAVFAGLVLVAGRRLGDQNDELISGL